MDKGYGEHIDWKVVKQTVLNRKKAELDKFCEDNGIVLKAIITTSHDGTVAVGQVVIDLA